MKNLMLAFIVTAFSLSAIACDGTGKGKKEKETEKRFEKITRVR